MRIMYIKKIYTYKIYKNFALLGNSFSTWSQNDAAKKVIDKNVNENRQVYFKYDSQSDTWNEMRYIADVLLNLHFDKFC
jgi:hypothetical protein